MGQYLSPGVYVEEKPSGAKPIEGVGTSTGAFVGIAEKGPIGNAEQIANWTQFVKTFGGYISDGYLAIAVNQFFGQGGTRCFVVRTCHYENITKADSKTARTSVGTLNEKDGTTPSMKLGATSDGAWGDNISVEIREASSPALQATATTDAKGFKLVVKYEGVEEEIFDNVEMDGVEDLKSEYIKISVLGDIPKIGTILAPYSISLAGGYDGLSPTSAGTLMDDEATPGPSIRVTAAYGGKWGNSISVDVAAGTNASTFKLTVKYGTDEETFDNLTISNVELNINNVSKYIKVEKDKWYDKDQDKDITGSGKVPKLGVSLTLAGGKDDDSALIDSDFVGDEAAKNGLHAFDVVDDINIVAIPDKHGDRDVILQAMSYCERRRDCFFIADPGSGYSPTMIQDFRNATGDWTGQNAFNSSFGALYYPWVKINHPVTGKTMDIPPSGTVAGTYAYTDSVRGVHKAPAGITEGKLGTVTGIERIITKSEHDGLNPIGINVIRSFPTSGIVIWGTRTLSADPEWKYLNIRRLFLFLEESIDKGSQWVVFEPNTPALWGSVKRNITAFLLRVWRDGALFGSTPEEAFFVKVDEENNPEEVRNAGQLIIDVGVAPVRPAEFVIIRISQKTLSK